MAKRTQKEVNEKFGEKIIDNKKITDVFVKEGAYPGSIHLTNTTSDGAAIFFGTAADSIAKGFSYEGDEGNGRLKVTSAAKLEELEVATPTGDNSAATKKYVDAHDGTVKDLTALTTQAAVWTELEKGGFELVKLTISGFTSLYTFKKSGTHWFGTSVINDGTKAELRSTTITETGGALAFSVATLVTKVSTPSADDEPANKKYVDDLLSEDITFTFDDGTTAVIKAGK